MSYRKHPARPLVVNWTAWGTFAAALMPLAQVSPPLRLFALIALFFGGMFFLYALKYYVSMALILVANGNGNGNGNGAASSLFNGNGNGHGLRSLGRNGEHHDKLPHKPFISIHLPLYNEASVVDRLLQSCTNLNYEHYEVVVADDSSDETIAILDQRWAPHPRVKISRRHDRSGFKGGALEKALEITDPRAEFIAVFDADFIPPPDILQQFLAYFYGVNGSNGAEEEEGADYPALVDDRLAVVQGYQWHILNASENWITRGIRTEFSGSYVIERSSQELLGAMKMISGSVFMIRADVLRQHGWGTSITEDWELTLRLYLSGYKVLYTPFIQAPSECVATFKQLARQRMRWAEGHTFNVKKYFLNVLSSPNIDLTEKLEFIYYAPYYLQSVFFIIGTLAWLISEVVLRQRLPMVPATIGWALVFTNALSLVLMNLTGLFMERGVRRNWSGLLSFILLTYLLVPYQAYAALKGLLEPHEGGWHRTQKTGIITDVVDKLGLGKRMKKLLPKQRRSSKKKSGGVDIGKRLGGLPVSQITKRVPAPVRKRFLNLSPGLRMASGLAAAALLIGMGIVVISDSRFAPDLAAAAVFVPIFAALATEHRRIGTRVISVVLSVLLALTLLALQVAPVVAAPDAFYLHDNSLADGLDMDSAQGTGAASLAFNSIGQTAHWYTSQTYPTGTDDANLSAGSHTLNMYFGAVPGGAASVDITVGVYHTRPDGSDPQLITSSTTTINAATPSLLVLDLGSGAAQTFTQADPRRLRVTVSVDDVVLGGSFTLNYDSAADPSALETPSLTVLDPALILAFVAVFVPIVTALVTQRRKLASRVISLALAIIIALALLSTQVQVVTAAPDAFYLHPTAVNDGEQLTNLIGSGASTLTFDTLNQTARWYTELDYPAGGDDATIAAGSYTFNLYFAQLPGGGWWDASYDYRTPITVSTGAAAVTAGYSVSLSFDHAQLVTDNKAKSDGDDLRVVHYDGANWTELDRVVDIHSGWDQTNTKIWFQLQDPIGANNSDASYYLYYGNPPAASPPNDPAAVFAVADAFDNGSFTLDLEASTAIAGSAVEDPGFNEAILDAPSDADAAILFINSALPFDRKFAIRHRTKLESGNGATTLMGVIEDSFDPAVTDSSTEDDRRRIMVTHDGSSDPGGVYIFYVDGSDTRWYWDGATWTTTLSSATLWNLNDSHTLQLLSDGTQWSIELRSYWGTLLDTTDPVLWSDVQDLGDDFWFYWGDPYTDQYSIYQSSDWLSMREYVDPEPTSALGSEQTPGSTFVDVTISVHHTDSDGSNPTLIVSQATTIDAGTSDPLVLDLGSAAEQTFTAANPQKLRVEIRVDDLSVGADFVLAYDSAADPSRLETPSLTVLDPALILTLAAIFIPIVTALITERRRMAARLISVIISILLALALLSTQIIPVAAAPDAFYLHDTAVADGKDMDLALGSGAASITFDTIGQTAHWYTSQTYPTGNDDATLSAGSHTFNMYFGALPGGSWWNPSYSYRDPITLTGNPDTAAGGGETVRVALDTASLVASGKMQSGGDDLRVVYWNGSSWIELDRQLYQMDSATTDVWFTLQAAIADGATNSDYYLYYGNAGATAPPTNLGATSTLEFYAGDGNTNFQDATLRCGSEATTNYNDASGSGTQAADQQDNANSGCNTQNADVVIGLAQWANFYGTAAWQVPTGARIVEDGSASGSRIRLWGAGDTGNKVQASAVYVSWIDSQVTWDERFAGTSWLVNGGAGAVRASNNSADLTGFDDASSENQISASMGTDSATWGTNLVEGPAFPFLASASTVQRWVTGRIPNQGLAIHMRAANLNDGVNWRGEEYLLDSTVRPRLSVVYYDHYQPELGYAFAGEEQTAGVQITVGVYHTRPDGTDPQLITSTTTSIDSTTANPLTLDLGLGAEQTFTQADPRRLRVTVSVDDVAASQSFILNYDSVADPSNLETPALTVADLTLIFAALAAIIPMVTFIMTNRRRRRLAARIISLAVSFLLALSLLSGDVITAAAAPDVFYLHDSATGTVSHVETQTTAQTTSTSYGLPSVAGGSNQLYLVAVAIYRDSGSSATVTSVDGGGLSWSLQVAQCSARINNPRIEIWQAYGSPSSFSATVNLGGGAVRRSSAAISSYSGADSTTPTEGAEGSNYNGQNGACGTGITDTDAATLSLTSSQSDSVLYAATQPRNRTISTPDPDYTERAFVDNTNGGDGANLYVHDRTLTAVGTDSVDHTLSGATDWDMAGLVINPGSAVSPAGKTMDNLIGAGASALTFDTAGQDAYWYSDVSYPSGGDDATIAAGNYTFNAYLSSLPTAGLEAKVETFTANSGTGNQSISTTGFQPKAVLFWITDQTAAGSAANSRFGRGWTDGSNQAAAATAWIDGTDTPSTTTAGRLDTDKAILLIDETDTVLSAASIVSLNSDGFTIDWTTAGGSRLVTYLALGGPALTNAAVGVKTLDQLNATESVTGLGFQPDGVLLFGARDNALDYGVTQEGHAFGVALSTTSRHSSGHRERASTGNGRSGYREDQALATADDLGTPEAEWDLQSLDAGGFTLVADVPENAVMSYLALEGVSIGRGILTQPTSTGNQSVTSLSFTPSVVMFDGGDKASVANYEDQPEMVHGVATGASERAAIWIGKNGTAADTHLSTFSVIRSLTAGTPTVDAAADFVSMNSNGFTIDWTTVDATLRKVGWVALGPVNPSVDITVSVHHTAADGSDPQLITQTSTTIDGGTSSTLALDLGSASQQTFTAADPRLLRVQLHVDQVGNSGAFVLDYDSVADPSNLDTPALTVPEFGVALIVVVMLIPVLTTLLTRNRRHATKLISTLVSLIFTLSLLATQVSTVTAAPDVFYLHDSTAGSGASWYDPDWSYRNKITIDNTQVSGTADLTYFPVLVSMTDPEWADSANGGKVDQADGGDILFTASDGTTKLDHEIESYDNTSGALVAWVEVPTVSYNSDTDIYIYYGNTTGVADQWNIAGTWDENGANNYKAVWHLDEEASGTGTADLYQDSTGNLNHADDQVSATGQTGQVNGGQQFDGADDSAVAPDYDVLGAITVEAWINWSAIAAGEGIISKRASTEVAGNWALRGDDTTPGLLEWMVWSGVNSSQQVLTTSSISPTAWTHVVVTFDDTSNAAEIYLDGTSDNSGSITNDLADTPEQISIGWAGQGAQYFNGYIDEVRISNSIRSADWIQTEYNNQSSPSTFFKPLGSQETNSLSPAGKVMNTVLGSGAATLTFDTAGQDAYWYSELSYPTGADDATIAAGNYTLNMYFNSLPSSAAPVVQATNTSNTSTASTSHTVDLPAGVQSGELLIAMVGGFIDTGSTPIDVSWPAGWTEFFEEDATSGTLHMAVSGAYRQADGTEGASVSATTNVSVLASHNTYRISGAADPAVQPPEATTAAFLDSDGTTIDPPSLAPTGGAKNYLWLAVAGWRRTGRNLLSSPTNYTDTIDIQSTGAGSGLHLASARRQLNAASEDPGVFTLDSNSERRVGATIAVHPPDSSVDITVSVHHTAQDGSTPTLITSASTTINSSTTDPLAFNLGSGAEQTFTAADPRLLRVQVTVDSITGGGSFVLDYDSAANPSSLDTPVVTVPEWGLAFLLLVPLVPFLMAAVWRRRRLAGSIASILLGAIVAISLLASQVTPTTAAPDVFYLHTDPTSGLTPAGEYMDLIEGTGGATPPTEVSATADTTTVSATDVAVSGMSITPGAGDYLVWFSGSVENSATGNQHVSLYLDGSQIAHSERQIFTEGSIPDTSFPVATHARLSGVTAGQTIEVRWRTDAGTATMHERTLVVQPMTPANTFQATATADTTTVSATDELVSGMTLTPGAGDYLVWFSGSVEGNTVGTTQNVSIYQNGFQIAHSERQIFTEGSIPDTSFPVATHAHITSLGASQPIEIRWRTSGGTATMHERTLVMQKIDSADITQVTASSDTTTVSATDVLATPLSVTPGAGDYLIWFSGSVENSATGVQNASLYVGGAQVAHTERQITTEGSIPDTSFPVAAHAYVTGVGASDTIEVQWRTSAGTATMHERTLTVQALPSSGSKTFDSVGNTYWYHDVSWPTGNDDANIAAGNYTFNMYFGSLPTGGGITVEGSNSGSVLQSDPTPHTINFNVTCAGSDRLLLVGISNFPEASLTAVSGVTVNGSSTGVDRLDGSGVDMYVNEGGNDAEAYIYKKVAPATGTNTVEVTFSPDFTDSGSIAGAICLSGVDQTTPLGNWNSNIGNAASPASVTVSSATDELVFSVAAMEKATDLASDGTDHWATTITTTNDTPGAGGSTKAGAASVTTTWTWSDLADHWAVGSVPIKPAGTGSASVDITVYVDHTKTDGTDPQPITSASTTINSGTTDPLAFDLGNDPVGQTFTSADPRVLRLRVEVTAVNGGGSFTLDYDGPCASNACSSLDTPVVVVPEFALLFGAFAALIPVVMGGLFSRRRIALRARAARLPSASRTRPRIAERGRRHHLPRTMRQDPKEGEK